ncbi:MAG: type II toxin-antitoxin system VapC family toxin [Cyanobacteria bacterium]|nr:type II toxin-antitoxin system VapC family toxin [Cyanobacteriota bacterium]
MSINFLLDTNVFSEPLRVSPNKKVMQKLKHHNAELAIAAPIWHELLVGCFRLPESKKRSLIERYLNQVVLPILPYDAQAARWHAAERARLISLGKTPPFVDAEIAAIAATQNLTLVTFNTADFIQFEDLKFVDWRK